MHEAFLAITTEFVLLPWRHAMRSATEGASQGGSQVTHPCLPITPTHYPYLLPLPITLAHTIPRPTTLTHTLTVTATLTHSLPVHTTLTHTIPDLLPLPIHYLLLSPTTLTPPTTHTPPLPLPHPLPLPTQYPYPDRHSRTTQKPYLLRLHPPAAVALQWWLHGTTVLGSFSNWSGQCWNVQGTGSWLVPDQGSTSLHGLAL